MNVPSFEPSQFTGYGIAGQKTAEIMVNSLKNHSLSVDYDRDTKKFIISGRSEIDKSALEKIFAENKYKGWQPYVLDETDKCGNRLVQLKPINYGSEFDKPFLSNLDKKIKKVVVISSFSSTREGMATELVSNLEKHLNISLKGKTCIDVGCRSGENAIAMQEAGANIVGIDPNDSEFTTAIAKGMRADQLARATLQEYHATYPNKKFDMATVFLWLIPVKERESFAKTLSSIIKPGGYVIISYHDEVFEDGPLNVYELMRKVFFIVEKFVFENSINRYILKCSNPKF